MREFDEMSEDWDACTAGMNRCIRTARQFLAAAETAGKQVQPRARILDLGCGAGGLTQAYRDLGWDARGADIVFRPGPSRETMLSAGALHVIRQDPYRLPFEDDTFDLVVSTQVFEHVQDHESTLHELARVQRPDGIGIHVFPARFRPLEIHTAIPFGGAWRNPAWLRFWSLVCRRLPSAQGCSLSQRYSRHRAYLSEKVNYLPRSELERLARISFGRVEFDAWAFLQHSPRQKMVRALERVPGRSRILGTFFEKTLILASPKGKD